TAVAPVAPITTRVSACPLSSVNTWQVEAPPHAESAARLLAIHCTVAPPIAVAPSGVVTFTRTGYAVSPPTGVAAFAPWDSRMVSFGPAPTVIAFVRIDVAPVVGS